jgi:uncharacterized membrane protein YfcA
LGGDELIDILIYALIGAAAGTLSGLFGIGGGIVIIPLLMFLSKFPQLKAQGTSIIAMLPPVGILAFLEYYKKGNVDIVAGIVICLTLVIFAKFGAYLAHTFPDIVLKRAFGVFVMLVGLKLTIGK